ncbi:FeoB-associated Cys-rich membrane protein [Desulforhopalus sp. IMCC35007]|uniref:FeoB-associated Cys-rich membrane protein n=1 Tax=Desulforhopalus sp. IMCC35007 TaxID=2569543 RepID=UPI00145D3779
MKYLETIIISIIIIASLVYLVLRFYRQWKALTDPSSPSTCGEGCCSCSHSSCDERRSNVKGIADSK